MIRWLVENVGLMLLAVIIAIVAWVVAELDSDPVVEDTYSRPIPVRVVNQPPGTFLAKGGQPEVEVTLRASRSVWEQLEPTDFEAVLNLSPGLTPLEPDTYSVPVEVSVKNLEPISIFGIEREPVKVLAVEPERVEVELEAARERSVPVNVQLRGEPESGYQASTPIILSDTVQVRGPASQVDQVVQAVGDVSLWGTRETIEQEVALTPVDVAGRRVGEVALEPQMVSLRVPVKPMPNVKEMSVTLRRSGEPAEGYRVVNVNIEPPVVRVLGPVFVLQDLPGFLTTVPISIEGRTEDVQERLPLELPAGVSMFDPDEPAVQVAIDIEPLPGSLTVTRTVTFQGLRPGLTALASPEQVEVVLSGPQPRLVSLVTEDVRVILDLSDLGLGDKQQLEPVVLLPEGITLDSIIPSLVQVEIVRSPAATRTARPTPTLAATTTSTITVTLTPEPEP